jgi:hypothetical protein
MTYDYTTSDAHDSEEPLPRDGTCDEPDSELLDLILGWAILQSDHIAQSASHAQKSQLLLLFFGIGKSDHDEAT